MSNLTETMDLLGYEGAKGTQVAGALAGTLADFAGAIGAVQLTVSLIESFFPQDDSMKQILSAIQAGFQQLEGQIAASDKLQRMRDVDQGINPAVGVFEQLPAILNTRPPVSQDFKLSQIQTCLDAVQFFTDFDDKWMAVQADWPYYSDSWSGRLAPPAGADGLVFNYTYTLPQFLRAIYFFLTAVGALEPTSLRSYTNVLNGCLARLQFVHDTIVASGIVGSRMPGPSDIGVTLGFDPTGTPLWQANWISTPDSGPTVYYPYGAIEVYSGVSNVSSYMDDFFPYSPDSTSWGNQSSGNFLTLVQFRIIRRMKELYVGLGLPAVWRLINQLRQLTGQPVSAEAMYNAWPFQDVVSLLNLTLRPQRGRIGVGGPFFEPAGLESALAAFLLATPPYAGFTAVASGPQDPRDPPQLTTEMPPIPLPPGPLYTFLTGLSLQPVSKLSASA
jgi:hypothetical protein